jgi:tetratricopeptide (TPR) repeat protein
MRAALALGVSFAAAALVPGCGGTSTETINVRETAAAALAKGDAAFASRDYAGALPHLEESVNSGGLNADAYSDAAVKLVVCYGATGKYDEALKLLEILEGGAPNLDQVYAARSFVLRKQGKVAEANAALAMARRYNRTIKEFQ